MTLDVGVVILCYGQDPGQQVNALINDLLADGVDAARVAVVRNPSTGDEPIDIRPPVTLLVAERNLGYAGGMNLGLAHMRRLEVPLRLLLTMDAHLDPGALPSMVAAAQKSTRYGVLGPVLRWLPDGHMTWGVRWSRGARIDHVLVRPEDSDRDGVVPADSVDGSVVLVGADLLEEIGPLSDRLFMYYEETELCLRAVRAGRGVGVVLGAVAQQSSGEIRRPGAFYYLMARNGLAFARLLAGRRAVAASLARYVWQAYLLTKMRFSPKSDAARRRRATVSLIGLWRGVFAYFLDRWGPPPEDLPGLGDITFPHGSTSWTTTQPKG